MKKVTYFFISALMIAMVLVLSAANPVTKITVWTIGDSTMAAKSASSAPESGWGEALQGYLKANATVKNRAANGRSTLSFINEGRWKAVIDSLKKGDYLIIQFGHNDQKENPKLHTDPFGSFQDNIRKFITEAKKKGATPIVCTSIVRRHFDGNRNLKDTHGDYIKGAWEVALATYTPCVDLEASTRELVSKLGPEGSKKLFTFTETVQDSTHLSFYGAKEVARLFVEEIKARSMPMKEVVIDF